MKYLVKQNFLKNTLSANKRTLNRMNSEASLQTGSRDTKSPNIWV